MANGHGAPVDNGQIYSVEEAGEYLRVSRSTIYRLVRLKEIGYIDFPGGKVSFTQAQLDDFLRRHMVSPVVK